MDETPFDLFRLRFTPIRVLHGKGTVYWDSASARLAYLTDHSEIPAESKAQLQGLDVLFLDALRHVRIRRIRPWRTPWNWWKN